MKRYYRTLAFYRSSKGGYWTVKIDQEGGLSCNCPKWLYRPENGQRVCKHIILAREEFAYAISQVKEHGLSVVESPFVPVDY